MNLNEHRHIYFIGIGGIGMSALARYFVKLGVEVSGYDKTETKLTRALMEEGIKVVFKDEIEQIPPFVDLVVYTPAIPSGHKQFNYLKERQVPFLKRAEMLGQISNDKFTIAIAGTHGKTTITSLVAHIFTTAGINIAAFVGGILKNYQTNFIGNADAEVFIAEADEYDRSFLNLKPDIGLISAVDADHLDIYKSKSAMLDSFKAFIAGAKPNAKWIINRKISSELTSLPYFKYDLETAADFRVRQLKIENYAYRFSVQTEKELINNLSFSIPGRHNLENVVGAVAIAKLYGIEDRYIEEGLQSYKGVERRFDTVVNKPGRIFIDDYAHHPEELKACIGAVREFYPDQKITGIFQPHLFSRTRDLADEFARSLEMLDELILLEIYPAREQPIEGINSSFLLKKVKLKEKQLLTKNEVLDFVSNKKPGVLLSLGAGDIDQLVNPIKNILSND